MGCASSSPLVNGNGGGPGGLVESVKTAANDVMTSGENAMNGKYYKRFSWWIAVFKKQIENTIQLLRKSISTKEKVHRELFAYQRVKFNFPQYNHWLFDKMFWDVVKCKAFHAWNSSCNQFRTQIDLIKMHKFNTIIAIIDIDCWKFSFYSTFKREQSIFIDSQLFNSWSFWGCFYREVKISSEHERKKLFCWFKFCQTFFHFKKLFSNQRTKLFSLNLHSIIHALDQL